MMPNSGSSQDIDPGAHQEVGHHEGVSLRVAQINLRKTFLASTVLNERSDRYDLALVQEPFIGMVVARDCQALMHSSAPKVGSPEQ